MSRDKQIEEMAKVIDSEYDCVIPCQSCAYYEYANCRDVKSAEKLYAAGYRKSTEIAEEIFEEIWENADLLYDGYRDIVVITEKDFAELKKKYTEGGE